MGRKAVIRCKQFVSGLEEMSMDCIHVESKLCPPMMRDMHASLPSTRMESFPSFQLRPLTQRRSDYQKQVGFQHAMICPCPRCVALWHWLADTCAEQQQDSRASRRTAVKKHCTCCRFGQAMAQQSAFDPRMRFPVPMSNSSLLKSRIEVVFHCAMPCAGPWMQQRLTRAVCQGLFLQKLWTCR